MSFPSLRIAGIKICRQESSSGLCDPYFYYGHFEITCQCILTIFLKTVMKIFSTVSSILCAKQQKRACEHSTNGNVHRLSDKFRYSASYTDCIVQRNPSRAALQPSPAGSRAFAELDLNDGIHSDRQEHRKIPSTSYLCRRVCPHSFYSMQEMVDGNFAYICDI